MKTTDVVVATAIVETWIDHTFVDVVLTGMTGVRW